MEIDGCQARCDEGKIICPGNQKTQIEQFEQSLPWVPCRYGDCSLATIDHGRSEAAVVSPAPCFGSDVIRAKDQVQMCLRHINPQICVRRDVRWKVSPKGLSRGAIPENSGATGLPDKLHH